MSEAALLAQSFRTPTRQAIVELVALPQDTRTLGELGSLWAVAADLDRLTAGVDAWLSRDGAPMTLAGADAVHALRRAAVSVRELRAAEVGRSSVVDVGA